MCFFTNTGAAEKQSRKYSFFATVFCIYPFTDSRSYIQKIRKPHSVFRIPCPATETVLLRKQIPYNCKKAGRDFAYTPLGIYNKKSVRAFPARTDFNL